MEEPTLIIVGTNDISLLPVLASVSVRFLPLLSMVFTVLGVVYPRKGLFLLAVLFVLPLSLYGGLGGNGAARLFLLIPVLLICAGIAGNQRRIGLSLTLAALAYLPIVWLTIAVFLQDF